MTRTVSHLAWLLLMAPWSAAAQDDTGATTEEPAEEEDPWSDLGSFSRPAPPASATTTRGPDRTMAVPEIDTPQMTAPSTGGFVAPTVALDAIEDREEFEQTLGANFASFETCYEQVPVENLSGHIELRWSVEGGRVTEARVVENTTGNSPVADCIIERIRGWSFPRNFEHELTYALEFHTAR